MTKSQMEDPGGSLGSPNELISEDIERLFQEHLNPLTRFVYSYVNSWAAAQDIVHDVFLQLWLRHRTLAPVRDLTAYVYKIARYDALDYLRHQTIEARYRRTPRPKAIVPAEAERDLLASETAAVLHRAIDALPQRQREIVLLRLESQASYQEIAVKLRISPNTVDTHLQRALARLRQVLPGVLG